MKIFNTKKKIKHCENCGTIVPKIQGYQDLLCRDCILYMALPMFKITTRLHLKHKITTQEVKLIRDYYLGKTARKLLAEEKQMLKLCKQLVRSKK